MRIRLYRRLGLAALSSGLLPCVALADSTVTAAVASETLTISWVIRNEKEKLLEQRARAVSDPQSPSYQKYLTYEKIDRKYRPNASRIQYVAKVLKSYGLSPRSMPRDCLSRPRSRWVKSSHWRASRCRATRSQEARLT